MKKPKRTYEGADSELQQILVSGWGVGQSGAVIEPFCLQTTPCFSQHFPDQRFTDFSPSFSGGTHNAYTDLKLNHISCLLLGNARCQQWLVVAVQTMLVSWWETSALLCAMVYAIEKKHTWFIPVKLWFKEYCRNDYSTFLKSIYMWAVLFLKTYTFFSSIKLLPADGNVWDFFFLSTASTFL